MLYATCRFSAQLCIQYSCACSRNRCLPPTRDFSIPFHGSTSSLIGRQWKTQQEPFFADGRAFKCSVLTKRVVKSACLRLVFAGTNECRDKIHHPASDCLLACEDHQGTTNARLSTDGRLQSCIKAAVCVVALDDSLGKVLCCVVALLV